MHTSIANTAYRQIEDLLLSVLELLKLSNSFFFVILGQTTQKPKKKKAKKKPVSTKNRAYCLTCLTDFKTKLFDERDTCLNPLYNVTDAELR